jgi:hypothetical protein
MNKDKIFTKKKEEEEEEIAKITTAHDIVTLPYFQILYFYFFLS